MIMSFKQRKIKFEPRIKLNHNIFKMKKSHVQQHIQSLDNEGLKDFVKGVLPIMV